MLQAPCVHPWGKAQATHGFIRGSHQKEKPMNLFVGKVAGCRQKNPTLPSLLTSNSLIFIPTIIPLFQPGSF